MKRFVKEYADYIREGRIDMLKLCKSLGGKIDYEEEVEFDKRIDKLLELCEHGLISTGEVMVELTKLGYPSMIH